LGQQEEAADRNTAANPRTFVGYQLHADRIYRPVVIAHLRASGQFDPARDVREIDSPLAPADVTGH